MKYIANQEIQTLYKIFKKGEFIPEEFVTQEMKQLKLVSILKDNIEFLTDNSSNINIVKELN